MEEHVYLCGWERSGVRFKVWLRERPFSRAEGESFDSAVENLVEAVLKDGGAVTPFFEFDPPPPKNELDAQFFNPELFLLTGDERFETTEPRTTAFASREARELEANWFEQFFTEPTCRKCRLPNSQRNTQPLPLRYVGQGYDGGFVSLGATTVCVYSENFLELFSSHERHHLKFQMVSQPDHSRRTFFELIGPPGPPTVAAAGLSCSGWRCEACGQRLFSYSVKGLGCSSFVAKSDLLSPTPDVFTIGPAWQLELCVTAQRWKQMVGKKGTKGFKSRPLGVLPDNLVIREPELKAYPQ